MIFNNRLALFYSNGKNCVRLSKSNVFKTANIFLNNINLCSLIHRHTPYPSRALPSNTTYWNPQDGYPDKESANGTYPRRQIVTILHLLAYYGCFYPHLPQYAMPIWDHKSSKTRSVFILQKKALRIVLHMSTYQVLQISKNDIPTYPSIYILKSLFLYEKLQIIYLPHP